MPSSVTRHLYTETHTSHLFYYQDMQLEISSEMFLSLNKLKDVKTKMDSLCFGIVTYVNFGDCLHLLVFGDHIDDQQITKQAD